jgi:hypothetical protein
MARDANLTPQLAEDIEKALQQCRDAVARLGERIARDVQRLGLDEMKWWNRMKAAARKKGVAEAMMKVERAKTQLTIVVQLLAR